MLILVTGGAGYIGSHTVKALKQKGFDVIVLDNLVYGHRFFIEDILKVPLIIGDISDKKLISSILSGDHAKLKGQKVDAIIHFAAYAYVGESVQDPLKYYNNNVLGSLNLLQSVVENNIHSNTMNKQKTPIPIIFSSTCATYGVPKAIPISEKSLQQPINPYGRTKLIVENIIKDFHKAYNLPFIIFRYFNAAGADPDNQLGELHNPETHLIPLAFDAVIGRQDKLKVFGTDYPTKDGTCIRDYIHVSDIANAHVLGLEKILEDNRISGAFNLGSGYGFSVLEIIKSIKSVTGREVPFEYFPRRPGDPPVLLASAKKALRELKWNPKSSNINTIILHAWNWHRKIFND